MNKMSALVRSEKNGRMSPLREKPKNPNMARKIEPQAPMIEERAEHSLLSDVKSTKSMPKSQTRKPGYEPMRVNKRAPL